MAEAVLVLAGLLAAGLAGALALRLRRAAGRRGSLLLGATLDASLAAVLLAVLFEALWGLNYDRPALARRLGWEDLPAPDAAPAAELHRLADSLLAATNDAYEQALGTPDEGRPTALRVSDDALERGLDRLGDDLDLGPGWVARRGRAKGLAASGVLTRLGLTGFFFPLTGEAGYNRRAPASSLPQVIAHEKAHQRGVAREDEAELLGVLACSLSGEPYARYSGLLHAQRQTLHALARLDRDAAARLVGHRHPGVQRDVDASVAFWRAHHGRLARLGRVVNDRYLRNQGVREGVASYGGVVRLLVLHARTGRGWPR